MSERRQSAVTIAAALPADERLVGLGAAVFAVHVWALGACAVSGSDGRLEAADLARCPWRGARRAGGALVDAGFWREVEGGYVLPAFLELNESRARLEERRRFARDRQARARGRAGSSGDVRAAPSPAAAVSLKDAVDDWLQRGGFELDDGRLAGAIDELQAERPDERLSPPDRARLLMRRQQLRLQASRVVPEPVAQPVSVGVRPACADFDDDEHRTFSAGQLQACIDRTGCGRCAREVERRGEEELRRRGLGSGG